MFVVQCRDEGFAIIDRNKFIPKWAHASPLLFQETKLLQYIFSYVLFNKVGTKILKTAVGLCSQKEMFFEKVINTYSILPTSKGISPEVKKNTKRTMQT